MLAREQNVVKSFKKTSWPFLFQRRKGFFLSLTFFCEASSFCYRLALMDSEMTLLLLPCILGGLMMISSLFLLKGKGAFLIAGYNLLSKEEKAKYDIKPLCRFTGKVALTIGFLVIAMGLGYFYEKVWLARTSLFLILGISVFSVIYSNTKNRFRK